MMSGGQSSHCIHLKSQDATNVCVWGGETPFNCIILISPFKLLELTNLFIQCCNILQNKKARINFYVLKSTLFLSLFQGKIGESVSAIPLVASNLCLAVASSPILCSRSVQSVSLCCAVSPPRSNSFLTPQTTG